MMDDFGSVKAKVEVRGSETTELDFFFFNVSWT